MEAEISHPLLLNQLRECFGTNLADQIDSRGLADFLQAVDRAYHEGDALRDRMRHSIWGSVDKLFAVSGGRRGVGPSELELEMRRATNLLFERLGRDIAEQVALADNPPAVPPVRPATILCVVEGGLLRLIQRLLSCRGYRVLLARNGREAWDIVRAYSGQIDLLIVDRKLPDMNGFVLRDELKVHFDGPAVVLTCLPPDQRLTDPEKTLLLRKPFSIDELSSKVLKGLELGCKLGGYHH